MTGGCCVFFQSPAKTSFFLTWLLASVTRYPKNDKVTTYKTFIATHKGEFFGIPASGKKVFMQVIDIIRLKDGRFTDHWSVLDWQAVMQQITS